MINWPLNQELLRWSRSKRDQWTIGDSLEHLLVLGSTGSGKSSGSLALIQKSMLRAGYGAVWLCAKADELNNAKALIGQTGRSSDVVLVGPGGESISAFDVFFAAGGIEGVVFGLGEILEILERRSGGGQGKDDFWARASKQLLRNIITVTLYSPGGLTLPAIYEILVSLPLSADEASDTAMAKSKWGQCLHRGYIQAAKATDLALAENYIRKEWPSMGDKTRSSIQATLTSMIDIMLREPLRSTFFSQGTVDPEQVQSGAIFIPTQTVKRDGEMGVIANVILKLLVQKTLERRGADGDDPRPVAIIADEFQFFASSYDADFASTARSIRGALVYATQNYSSVLTHMGGGESAKSRVDSLLGNLGTWIGHRNSEHETNKIFSERVGQIRGELRNKTFSFGGGGGHGGGGGASHWNAARGQGEQILPDIQPRIFTGLKSGGERYRRVVEGIVSQSPRRWSNGKRWLRASFFQGDLTIFGRLITTHARSKL